MPLNVMSSNNKKKKPAFELVPFFYFQNLDLGFFTNDQNTIFHVSF